MHKCYQILIVARAIKPIIFPLESIIYVCVNEYVTRLERAHPGSKYRVRILPQIFIKIITLFEE